MPNRAAVIVLGMHRSGTSALTRTLNLCGLGLPAHLIPASRKNERGYFESQVIYGLHEELLESAGTSWYDPNPFPETWYETDAATRFARRMADAVRSEFGDGQSFVLKDPRVCRLVPFWLRVMALLDVTPLFVLPIRDPVEVAASLHRSEGVAEELGRWLWLTHLLAAERDTRDHKRSFVTYTALLADWRSVIARIERDLEIRLPRRSRAAEAEIDGFLSPELRHELRTSALPEGQRGLSAALSSAYRWALRAATEREPERAEMDALRQSIATVEETVGPLVGALEYQRRRALDDVARLEDLAIRREREIIELRAAADEARTAASEARRDLARTRETARMLLRWAVERGRGDEPLPDSLRSALELFQKSAPSDLPTIAAVTLDLTERRLEIERLERDRLAAAAQVDALARRLGEVEDAMREREQALAELRARELALRHELLRAQDLAEQLQHELRAHVTRRRLAETESARLTQSCRAWIARSEALERTLADLCDASPHRPSATPRSPRAGG